MSRLGVSGLGSQQKYGLILPNKAPAKPSGPVKKQPLKNIFGQPDEEEEEHDTGKRPKAAIQQMAEHRRKKLERIANQALAEDASVFDYDSVQPSFAAARADQQQQATEKQVERKSQYIGTLLKKAEFRTKEQELILEKKRVKDRQQEDHLYGDKEKFVTAAYKKKLQEEQRWLEEQNARDALDTANDVTKKTGGGAMLSFYSNVLNAGGATRSHIIEEKTKTESAATASDDNRKRSSRSPSPDRQRDRDRDRDRERERERERDQEREPKRLKAEVKPSPDIETSTSSTAPVPSQTPAAAEPPSVAPSPSPSPSPAPAPVPAPSRDPAAEAEARKQKAEEARRKYMERKKAAQG